MKTLGELIDVEDSGWNIIKEWMSTVKNQYSIIPKDQKHAKMN